MAIGRPESELIRLLIPVLITIHTRKRRQLLRSFSAAVVPQESSFHAVKLNRRDPLRCYSIFRFSPNSGDHTPSIIRTLRRRFGQPTRTNVSSGSQTHTYPMAFPLVLFQGF